VPHTTSPLTGLVERCPSLCRAGAGRRGQQRALRLLLNASISRLVGAAFAESVHAASLASDSAGPPDADVLRAAHSERRILASCDKGTPRRKPHSGVVILRLRPNTPQNQSAVPLAAIRAAHLQWLLPAFTDADRDASAE